MGQRSGISPDRLPVPSDPLSFGCRTVRSFVEGGAVPSYAHSRKVRMEYTRIGSTGLKVSRLALGCMSYGDPTAPNAHVWALAEDLAQPFFEQAVELGVISGTPRTSTNSALPKRSSAAPSPVTPAVRTSCSRRRCGGGCTTARVERACLGKRSSNRSMRRGVSRPPRWNPIPCAIEPPIEDDDGVAHERMGLIAATSHGGTWKADNDLPMYLHTFAYIAGGALRNWWWGLAPSAGGSVEFAS